MSNRYLMPYSNRYGSSFARRSFFRYCSDSRGVLHYCYHHVFKHNGKWSYEGLIEDPSYGRQLIGPFETSRDAKEEFDRVLVNAGYILLSEEQVAKLSILL